MKTISFCFLATFILFASGILNAQEYKTTVQNSIEGKVILNNFNGFLPIEGYAGNEIIVTGNSGKIEIPEKAKGLTPIYPSGTDNTGIGISVEKAGNLTTITCLIPFTRDGEFKMKLPDNLALELSSTCERSNDIEVSNMKNEIVIENCNDIKLKNVTGPLVLSTIAGDIEITYGKINAGKASSINSISGDVDITMPSGTATNLELHTIEGKFYSDFDFSSKEKDLKMIGGNNLNFPLNGGGPKFSINTISGDIYLRKAK
jgi:hypothetical protein